MKEITRNIGTNRGNRRVWIEGKSLANEAWNKGVRYKRIETANGWELVRDDNGPLKIAGGDSRPVIDLCGGYVGKTLQGFDKVSVKITANKIVIQGAACAALLIQLAA
tara:strand:+ start:260 stop:583 length:324 start_codon:yes stop_codon:yes gene_type:complete